MTIDNSVCINKILRTCYCDKLIVDYIKTDIILKFETVKYLRSDKQSQ